MGYTAELFLFGIPSVMFLAILLWPRCFLFPFLSLSLSCSHAPLIVPHRKSDHSAPVCRTLLPIESSVSVGAQGTPTKLDQSVPRSFISQHKGCVKTVSSLQNNNLSITKTHSLKMDPTCARHLALRWWLREVPWNTLKKKRNERRVWQIRHCCNKLSN